VPHHHHILLKQLAPDVERRKLILKAKVESSSSDFRVKEINSRRFQREFDRVNLHRLPMLNTMLCSVTLATFTWGLPDNAHLVTGLHLTQETRVQ
jgi:hypothetical protein